MMPAAPAMFSTTIAWPMLRDIVSATLRATTSVSEPAAVGTIRRIARFG
jgi:hypothetical protein